MRERIGQAVGDAVRAVEQLAGEGNMALLEKGARLLASCFASGHKLIVAGNGGSLCDAAHFAEELTGVFRKIRPALAAISLSEPGHLSCVANDLGYEHVFSRGIEALGQRGDVFAGLTTSGQSANLINAFEIARKKGLKTMAFLGKGGGKLRGVADFELLIDGFSTSDRIQEAHMAAIHILIEMTEYLLFDSPRSEKLELDEMIAHA